MGAEASVLCLVPWTGLLPGWTPSPSLFCPLSSGVLFFLQNLASLKTKGQLLIGEIKELSELLLASKYQPESHESSKDEPLLLCQSIFGYKRTCQLMVGQYF